MTDIKAIKEAAEAATPQPWIESGAGNMPFICMMTPDTVSAMCDEIERLRVDAARYQFLRDQDTDLDALAATYYPGKEVPSGEELDAVIDSAMEAK